MFEKSKIRVFWGLVLAAFWIGSILSAYSAGFSASDPAWLRAGHYKKRFPFGGIRSEVSEGSFFVHPNGQTSPELEWEATHALLESGGTWKTRNGKVVPARCAFPYRALLFEEKLGVKVPAADCPEIDAYFKKLKPKSLTLVFSSSYPNSPPSMFGHSFFRVNQGKNNPLSDFGINYSAWASGDDGSLFFAFAGIFGGYYGNFSIEPYFLKVNEYSHSESRDLWEYDLSLTSSEVRRFLLHLWELDQNALFRYYFADENCSYRLLTLLEAVKPDWNLSGFAFHAIPSETIRRVVDTPGAVASTRLRPSIRRELSMRYEALDADQKLRFLSLIDLKKSVLVTGDPNQLQAQVINEPSAEVLDAVLAYHQYRKTPAAEFQSILKRRSELQDLGASKRLGVLVQAATLKGETRPELGHAPYRLRLVGGHSRSDFFDSGFLELGFKIAYHDLLNNDLGYTRLSHVDFPSIDLRVNDHSFWIERLGFLSVTSLFPLSRIEKQPSWKFEASYGVPKDLGCETCHTFELQGGAGASVDLIDQKLLAYSLVLFDLQAGSVLDGFLRAGPALQSALLLSPFQNLKVSLGATLATDLFQSHRPKSYTHLDLDASWNPSQNWDVRGKFSHTLKSTREISFGLYRYF